MDEKKDTKEKGIRQRLGRPYKEYDAPEQNVFFSPFAQTSQSRKKQKMFAFVVD